MRKNRRNNAKKERTIMIASSVFVLSALTMTGIYMKSNQTQEQDDGYTLDFTALEDSVDDKFEEIAENSQTGVTEDMPEDKVADNTTDETGNLEDDLDYLPMEVGSGTVTIPGLTDRELEDAPENPSAAQEEPEQKPVAQASAQGRKGNSGTGADADATPTPDVPKEQSEENADTAANTDGAGEADVAENADSAVSDEVEVPTLHFSESDGLLWPVSGEVLIPFSMDSSVYFSTLDQFKYNPALMLTAETGAAVAACAGGRVISVFENEEIGKALTMELGDGYEITYGQLEEIRVTEGSYVESGEIIAFIASPTKYFSVEGSNLYLKLTMNGVPVDPEGLLR